MRKYLLNGVAMILATFFIGACNKVDELDNNIISLNNDGKTLVANIVEPTSGDIDTRTSISSSFKFTWAEGDILGIYPDEGDQIYFKITDGIGSNTATFNGGGWALKKGYTYYSYYPFSRDNFSSEETKEAIPVSIEGQSIDGSDMFGHLGKYDPMFAQSENSTGSIAWDFQHLVSWLKLKVTLPVNCNISKIVLSNADGLLHTKGTVDITAPSPAITATNNLQEISIPCENVAVKANEETVIPIAIIPTDLTGKTITIKIFTDYFDYIFDISVIKEWKQGYYYSQELTNNDEIPVYTVTTAGTLSSLVGESRKFTTDKMKIIGNLNGSDIKFIREMAGVNVKGENTGDGKLTSLDLSKANIVAGGDPYYSNAYNHGTTVYTEDNTIGRYMFEYSRLNNIILPNTVTTIKETAFAGCPITTLGIPESVTDIDIMALTMMPALTEFTGKFASASKRELISGNTLIALAASGLSGEYIIPQGITVIGDGAFAFLGLWCKLTSVIIPEGVETIGTGAFWGSVALKNITIPNSVKTIGVSAFGGCENLTNIVIPEGITRIEPQTFYRCQKLTNFTIPNGVISIGDLAFNDCINLSSIVIPSSVKSIGTMAFKNCPITKVYITDLSTYCEYDSDIWNYYYSLDEGKNCLYVDGNLITNLVIPDNVTKIGSNAFEFCADITSVIISDSVKSIGYRAFGGCVGINNIIIPDNVTNIDNGAFSECTNLAKVILGSGIESIGNYCFDGCEKLCEIECHATTPPTIDSNPFLAYGYIAKCYVPKGSKNAYQNAGWGNYFDEIVEME